MSTRAVVLLKSSGDHYSENRQRTKLLLDSIAAFDRDRVFESITILSPPDELSDHRSFFASHANLDFVGDDELVRNLSSYPASGWKKQQFLKLAFAASSHSDYVVTFDPDMFAARPFSASEMFSGQRAFMDMEPKSVHSEWWTTSADLLRYPAASVPEDVMTVTPCTYSSDVARLLKRSIANIYGARWEEVLLGGTLEWVEHALYFVTLLKYGLLDEFHVLNKVGANTVHSSANLWFAEHRDNWRAENLVSSEGIFATIASSAGLDFAPYEREIRSTLNLHAANA